MKILTYTHSRPFGPYTIPISVQSVFLRSYCMNQKLEFYLPTTEYSIKNCYASLNSIIKQNCCLGYPCVLEFELLTTSIYIFEELDEDSALYHELLQLKLEIHCVLEGVKMRLPEIKKLLKSAQVYNCLAIESPVLN